MACFIHTYSHTHTHTCILYNNTHTWMLYVCVSRVNRFEGPDGGRDLSTSLDKRGAPQGWTFADLCLPCRLAICVCMSVSVSVSVSVSTV